MQAAVQEAAPPPPPITSYGPDGSPDELPPDLLPSARAESARSGGLPATVEELGLVTPTTGCCFHSTPSSKAFSLRGVKKMGGFAAPTIG